MRRLPLLLALLSACGSSDPAARLFGDFEVQDGTAIVMAPGVCDLPFVGTVSIAAVAIVLTDHPDACGVVTQTQLCGTRESSSAVVGVAIQGVLGAGGIAGATPGTYVFLAEPPTGPFRAIAADAARVDATCTALPGGVPDTVGGTITLDSITAERVAGTLALRFERDQALDEPFDVAICPVSLSTCAFIGGPCSPRVCAPAP